MGDTLILGLGNPLRGDDGVGTAVIQRLQHEQIPPGVDLVDGGTPGLDVVLLLREYRRVIVVDAADMGLPPGTWQQFAGSTAVLPANGLASIGTLHSAGLAEALALAEALGVLPDLTIFGVQPEKVDWTQGLSDSVKTAVAPVCRALLAIL